MASGEEVFTTEEVQEYLRAHVLKDIDLVSPKFHITMGSKEGDNYIGVVYRVMIEGVKKNGVNRKLDLIVKTRRNLTDAWGDMKNKSSRLFQREIEFYQEILPLFQKIGKKHGATVRCPFIYTASIEIDRELLVIENLNSEGFVMNNSKILDYPHMSLALRCLGEFHAHSFLIRASNPTESEKLKLTEPLYDKGEPWLFNDQIRSYFETARDVVIKALADEDKHYSERYQRFANNLDDMFDTIDWKQVEPYAAITHGDLWTNNLLFKYDKNGVPCDMRFIDFQIARYASPAIDVIHIFSGSCAPEVRSKYYDQLLREYHDALSKCLRSFGYDPDDLYPYDILLQHLKKFGKYGAGIATFMVPVLFNDAEDKSVQNLFSQEALEEKLKTNSHFRNCIKSVFIDLVDKNYI